ncbi:MAG TPA: type II CAAX endopeptidase family protein [Solirubrobacteraceae bacterium]|nr:type II CAAX endopeptidase family protein [Solirubrobacteraceae bacterium]
MSSLQSPSAPGEPSPMQADSFGQALAAERQAREQRTPDWPPWMAPAALVGGVVLSMVGVLIVELPAAAFGVDITASHMPAGLTIADTVVQDIGFILVAVLCARMGGRTVRSWQFGLRRPRVGWWRASGLIFLLLLAFVVVSAIWSALVNPEKEKVLETLGSNAGTTLLLLSAALTCIVAPICEEFLFRGFIFTALRNWKGTWPAAIITGLLFGGVHFGSAPALDLVPLAGLGFGLCLLYRVTGSLYPCIAAHSLNNSIAYGSLESWAFWQVLVLMAGSLVVIWAMVLAAKRFGLISAEPLSLPQSPAVFAST